MTGEARPVRWIHLLLCGFLAIVLAQVVATLVVVGYAFYLAFQVRGAPNPLKISQFAIHTAPWTVAIAGIVLAFVIARRVARRSRNQAILAGTLVGAFAALFDVASVLFFGGRLRLFTIAVATLLLLAGWSGGRLSTSSSPATAAGTD